MTHRDTLFLLPAGFADNDRREYCPECAEMWGLLCKRADIILSIMRVTLVNIMPRVLERRTPEEVSRERQQSSDFKHPP